MPTKGRAAIFVEPKEPLVVDEVEFADPATDQVLVKLFASGVCHSQLHTMQRPARPGQRLPALLGHESTGVVVATGRDVKHVEEGDHVITTWVDRDNSTTNQPLVAHALNDRAQSIAFWKGQEVMHSAASIGLCAISAAAIVDANPIIAVDINDQKLEFARRFGATHIVNSKEGDALETIRKLTDGGVDYAIDAVGLPQTQEQILGAVRPGYSGMNRGGTALLVGITPPDAKAILDTSLFIGNRSFTRTSGGDCRPARDFPIFIRWYRDGKLKLNDLVTHRYKLEQINQAIDDLQHGRILGRGILTYD